MRRQLFLLGTVLAFSCGPPPTKDVKPELVPPTLTQDFGTLPVLNSKTLELPLKNLGRGDLNVTNVKLSPDSKGFTLLNNVEGKIIGGEEFQLKVSFKPGEEKDYTGTLSFDSDDENYPHVDVKLVGKGSTRAIMEVTPDEIDFGRVPECSSAVKTFTITSSGTADLVLEEISFTKETSPAFSFVGSTRTPATVKFKGTNGLPGQILLTVKYTASAGDMGKVTGAIRIRGTDPSNPEVLINLEAEVNRAPVPKIVAFGNGAPGSTVALDSTGTADPDGDSPLTYKWTLRSKPLSSATTIAAPTEAITSMRLDPQVPGSYEVQLDVTDSTGVKACQPARATVVAAPAQKLLVEMFWDNAKTDIDLHVLRTTNSTVGSGNDCHYANQKPDWGATGPDDDPELIRDALTGYGPELFGYVNPIDTTYRIVAEFSNEHLEPNPASKVTVRVYLFGVVKGEFTRTLEKAGNRWVVADVTWPSGVVAAVP